jgi:TRAP-type C4-dicarboxylate transport system permease small subunit
MLRRLLDGLYLLSGYLAGLFLVAIFLLMLALSIGRKAGINVKAGDDFTAWCMAAMAFLGLAHTFRSGELIRMGLIVERLEGAGRRRLELFALLLGALVVAYFAYATVKLTYFSWLINDLSTGVIIIPLWLPQLALAIGTSILLIAFLDEIVHVLRGRPPSYSKSAPKTREEVIDRAASGNL